MFSCLRITNYSNIICKASKIPLKLKKWKNKANYKIYDKKLDNSISRARSSVFEIALCNEFYWYVTLTINKNHDRYSLGWLIRSINQIIRDMRKKFVNKQFYYLLIPEHHKDGAWHLHGFFSYDFIYDFYINKNNYISWFSYDKIGYVSVSIIESHIKCVKYITKYITKDIANYEKGARLYYCSQGLKRKELDSEYILTERNILMYDGFNNYVAYKELSINEAEDLKNNYLNKYCYSYLSDF